MPNTRRSLFLALAISGLGSLFGNYLVVLNVIQNATDGLYNGLEDGIPSNFPFTISNLTTSTATTTTTKRAKSNNTTIILGFANAAYRRIALDWYKTLEQLGYDQHWAIATDDTAAAFFQQHNLRYDYQYQQPQQRQQQPKSKHYTNNTAITNTTKTHSFIWTKETCPSYAHLPDLKLAQTARRALFGGRWQYIARQLQAGYHVLVTDVDNLFHYYKPMTDMEDAPYDVFHAFAGDLQAFPLRTYRDQGFTLCGGMSWLRSTPSVLKLVREILSRCGCDMPDNSIATGIGSPLCDCHCDDQVVLNNMYRTGPYKVKWNQSDHQKIVAHVNSQVDWDGFDGVCPKTGHRIRVWDRHLLWRGNLHTVNDDDPNNETITVCPSLETNWIAMPTQIEARRSMRKIWNQYCGRRASATATA